LSASTSIYLDGDSLRKALVSGTHRVMADQDFLNKINVFPVADGDTGTNLSLSLGATLGVLQAPADQHVGTILASVADALLDGARGNSGAIMAQFFQGASDSASDLTRFTTATFSQAVRTGSDYAHDALSNPVEGTILSVIAAFAASIETRLAAFENNDFGDVFEAALPALDQALAATTGQLDVLRKAGVVDAGARGFVDLVKGMSEFILHGRMVEEPDLSVLRSTDFSSLLPNLANHSCLRAPNAEPRSIFTLTTRKRFSMSAGSMATLAPRRRTICTANSTAAMTAHELLPSSATLPLTSLMPTWSDLTFTWCLAESSSVIAVISTKSALLPKSFTNSWRRIRIIQRRHNPRRETLGASFNTLQAITLTLFRSTSRELPAERLKPRDRPQNAAMHPVAYMSSIRLTRHWGRDC
jgi:hypothetical protein